MLTRAFFEKHGPMLCVRRDIASVNVSQPVLAFLNQHVIRSETYNPYEPWQNGQPDRLIQTLCTPGVTACQPSHDWEMTIVSED